MIKIVTNKKQLDFLKDTPFGCKIISTAYAYGVNRKPVTFWVQNSRKAAIVKIDDTLILADNGLNPEELIQFINMINPKNISCLKSTAVKLGLHYTSYGEIMLLSSKCKSFWEYETVINPGIREIYRLLCVCRSKNFIPPEFEPFYLDLSHRTRHGAALSTGVKIDKELAACAVCTAVSQNSAVACLPEFRRNGLATSAVLSLIKFLGRDIIYIFRANGENEKFYHSMGFEPYNFWSETLIS